MSETFRFEPPHPEVADVLDATPHIVNVAGLDAERLYGRFPALVELDDSRKPTVYFDNGTLGLFVKNYCSDSRSERVLKSVYVKAGMVNALLRDMVEPHNEAHVAEVYASISSADELMREIYDTNKEFGLSEEHVSELLLAIRDGLIKPDISGINATRLSIGLIAINQPSCEQDLLDFSEICRQGLVEEFSKASRGRYTSVFTAFGGSEKKANQNFLGTITPLLVAGSYPMLGIDAEALFRVVQGQ